MRLHGLRAALAMALLCIGAQAGAVVQENPNQRALENMIRNQSRPRTPYAWEWVGERAAFDQQVYLARCTGPCPGDGLMLVPDVDTYRPGTLVRLGGPYSNRFDVELDRERLVAGQILPSYSLRLHVFDWSGEEIGAFWFGAEPGCNTPELAQAALAGQVNADFSPRPPVGRPPAVPLPIDWDRYESIVESVRAECSERLARARAATNHICSGAYGCRPITGN